MILRKGIYYLVVLGLMVILSSCNVCKILQPGEILVNSHKVKIIDDIDPVEDKEALKTNIKLLVLPRPDGKLLFIRTKVSDPAPLLNLQQLDANKETILGYLKDQGYRQAEVEYEVMPKDNCTANVVYTIHTNRLLRISNMEIFSRDSSVQEILKVQNGNKILRPGVALSRENSDIERARIVAILRNHGYATFLPNYIDQIRGNKETGKYQMEVLLINDSIPHKKYHFGNINVFLEEPQIQSSYAYTDTLDRVIYHYNSSKPFLKTSLLNRKLAFRPNQLYSKKLIDESRVLLRDIPFLRGVTISNSIRYDTTNIIDYALSLQRNLKYDFSVGLRAGYVLISEGDRIGFTAGVTLSDKNIFGNGELFTIDYSGGVDFDIISGTGNGIINTNFQLNHDLSIPSFIDLSGLYGLGKNLGLLGKPFYDNIKLKGQTKFEANVQFLTLENDYSSISYELNYGHRVRYKNTSYDITQSGLIIWNTDIDTVFENLQTISNPNLLRSLESRVLSGLLFRSLYTRYQSPISKKGKQWTVLGTIDASGHEVFLVNSLYRWISKNQTEFSIGLGGDTLRFAQFLKLDLDTRYSKALFNSSSVTFRLATGIALPYGFTREGNVVPYLNQFDVGGPYSIRAWEQRQLGPGGVEGVVSTDPRAFTPAQKGDIRLEFNIEYRFPIAPVFAGAKINGALFLDAGNVWLLKALPDADIDFKGVFTSQFYKQIAIGAGYGLRLDFDYFVIRFDFGYKLKRPYANDQGRRWVLSDIKLLQPNINFAIGYPF